MIKNISSSIRSRRKGGWEDAMRRLASFSKCLLNFDIDGREVSDKSGGAELTMFKVAFILNVDGGKTTPKRFKLKHPELAAARGIYELRAENFTKYELQKWEKTRSDACRRYLTMTAGKTLGVCDGTPPSQFGGYSSEIFRPVLTVPEFGSLKELNLKLDVMGA
jgi:hypothetical protein